ncbi:unnamed protein product [Closterium sp. Yama58-4]|nr:unnamed protein product [Closterium sp. Yama58-4]
MSNVYNIARRGPFAARRRPFTAPSRRVAALRSLRGPSRPHFPARPRLFAAPSRPPLRGPSAALPPCRPVAPSSPPPQPRPSHLLPLPLPPRLAAAAATAVTTAATAAVPAAAAPAVTTAAAATTTAAAAVAVTAAAAAVVTAAAAVHFEVWLDDLQLFLQCDSKDDVSLYDLTSGASPQPAADADATVRSRWNTRDAAARLAVRSHLPSAERAHFTQFKTAKTLFDAVVARYSSPASAALSRLMLPYLFPDLAAFDTVVDLIAHLRTSDTRYRAALPAEFCAKNPPPMYITLYYLVTRLPDSLRSVRDHFLAVCPTTLIVDLLAKELLAAEQSIVAVGASRGDPRAPIFEGCSPVPLLPSVASAAAVDLLGTESVGAASAPSGRRRNSKGKGGKGAGGDGGGGGGGGGGGRGGGGGGGSGGGGGGSGGGGGGGGSGNGSDGSGGGGGGGGGSGGGSGGGGGGAGRGGSVQTGGSGGGQRQQQQRSRQAPPPQQLHQWYAGRQRPGGPGPCTYVLRTGDRTGEPCGGPHTTQRCFGRLTDAWRIRFPDATELPHWHELLRSGVPIFDLDYDAILAAMC